MPRRHVLIASSLLGAAALAGCGSPVVVEYRLAAIPGRARTMGRLNVSVRSILIPGYLDQGSILAPGGAYRVNDFAGAAWAEPLADMLQAVLVADLAQRLEGATVFADGAIGAAADATIEVDVQRFDFDADGTLNLTAQFGVKTATDAGWTTQAFQMNAAPEGTDVTAVVAAMSMLWARAADQLADRLA